MLIEYSTTVGMSCKPKPYEGKIQSSTSLGNFDSLHSRVPGIFVTKLIMTLVHKLEAIAYFRHNDGFYKLSRKLWHDIGSIN